MAPALPTTRGLHGEAQAGRMDSPSGELLPEIMIEAGLYTR